MMRDLLKPNAFQATREVTNTSASAANRPLQTRQQRVALVNLRALAVGVTRHIPPQAAHG